MKKMLQLAAVCWLLVLLDFHVATAYAQGALAPPGSPAATMKTLDQIEARTIVNAVNTPGDANNLFIVSQPGSYYLTTNLVGVSGKNGILIVTNNVSLDLNSFAVQGVASTLVGIYLPNAVTNIIVRNGIVSGWGAAGLFTASASIFNMVVERINASGNGTIGIRIFGAGVVRDCTSHGNGTVGIFAGGGLVTGCTAQNNVSDGIYAQSSGIIINSCTSQGNLGSGIYAIGSATVINCLVQNNSTHGIFLIGGGTVSGCTAQNCGGTGIYVRPGIVSDCFTQGNTNSGIYVDGPGSAVIGNTCTGNNPGNLTTAAGIFINDARNRIEDNHVSANGYAGIQVRSFSGYTNNLIIKNSVESSVGANFITPNAQIVGPLITNTVSGIITNSNPWANFSF